MKQTLLIALLALAGFTALPATAEDASPAPAATQTAAAENLSAPGKPCDKPGMGGMGMGGMGMGKMQGMMGGDVHACPTGSCGCKQLHDMSERIEQLEKRIDALQMSIQMLVNQQDE